MEIISQKEEAVSPVIGVMLMIVVTIIIAAAVSAFATGLSDNSANTPVSSFEFKAYSNYIIASDGGSSEPYLEATMKSGETIDTSNLKIVSYHEAKNGTLISHEFTQSTHVQGAKGTLTTFRSFSGPGTALYFGDSGSYWHMGDKFTGGINYVLGVPEDEMEAGDKIDIDMVYKPTNTIIWSDEVTII